MVGPQQVRGGPAIDNTSPFQDAHIEEVRVIRMKSTWLIVATDLLF